MKLEIVKTVEVDGTWYKILKDGNNIESFKVSESRPEEMARDMAKARYQQMIDISIKNILPEVIESIELP
jgi:hypothetical protein